MLVQLQLPFLQRMLISIITPSYNQCEHLEDTIKCVFGQEGDFSIDYIVIDGGSSDRSVDSIRNWEQSLNSGAWKAGCKGITFRWISEPDNGQVDAIEKGFAMAKGDIACWLNSDDVFENSRVLASAARHFKTDPSLDMLTGDGPMIGKNGERFGVHHVDFIDVRELLYLDYHILQPSTFIRRNVFTRERLDRSYDYCFDAEYFIRLITRGYRFKKVNDSFGCSRQYPETKTMSGQERRYRESLRISRQYGDSRYCYLISMLYKYFDIVLRNRYPESMITRKTSAVVRRLAYLFITGRPGRRTS